MMASPEYERWSALRGEDYDKECEKLGLFGYLGERREYQARVNRIRELALEGKGPGAWCERFHHECEKPQR